MLGGLLSELDDEFLRRKGRPGSVVDRNPALFSPNSTAHFAVLSRGGRDVACACLAPRVLTGTRRSMITIGLVFVVAQERGQGLGYRLMRHVSDLLEATSQPAVLWTTQPEFYSRAGWHSRDSGVVFELAVQPSARLDGATDGVVWERTDNVTQYLAGASQLAESTLVRDARSIESLPAFAVRSSLWLAMRDDVLVGSAIIAESGGGSAHAVDVCASLSDVLELRAQPAYCQQAFIVNDSQDSDLVDEAKRAGIETRPSRLAMWLNEDASSEPPYIPWIDRL